MYGKTLNGLSDRAKNFVMTYEWPGNIRELENLLERATLLTDHQQEIKLNHLFPQIKQDIEPKSENLDLNAVIQDGFCLEDHERQLILIAMQKANQNVSEAARILGISRAALDYRLKKQAVNVKVE